MAALATQASVAIRAAQDFERMATWAAQLQSIQQLGRPAEPPDRASARSAMAIATELRQLIDYHNVRVYRLVGDDLIPVAMQGQVGEYVDETPDQLRVTLGEGITGWVAAQPDRPEPAATPPADPRANTIPGTEDDLDESMLLAPMIFDDQVLGVLVLSKLGLDQFTRRRPAAARDLRQLRRPGDGQRRHDRAAARADGRARAPAPRPARAAADHRVDPDHARRPGASSRASPTASAASIALRQHRHRGRRPGDRAC